MSRRIGCRTKDLQSDQLQLSEHSDESKQSDRLAAYAQREADSLLGIVTYNKPLAEALISDQLVHVVQTVFGVDLSFSLPG